MKRVQVISTIKNLQTNLKVLGVNSLALFGSVARDEAQGDSDVNILVDLKPPITFDRYMDVKLYLDEQLGTRVDLVTWKALKPQIRETVKQEAIYVM
ncbi:MULTISPECIES: nucleotidyltransferase family protein [Fischerella]|uniref:DNA polymerase subunit beta n=1 Tax=Fischerella muscicola CCMEE 5323 TaxID=2019572 RepID=A0A2N6K981_FISMU|nr:MULTISPECIES: nucleotidyltransferase family protein [Fischerella]MBD2433862.1 nucleotidyltransferase family protein [Fischerella sp. FACHB-380]PLZ94488.1 DNA polymerase subunit beta [Fischerella muscicola CCMEE 5323]